MTRKIASVIESTGTDKNSMKHTKNSTINVRFVGW